MNILLKRLLKISNSKEEFLLSFVKIMESNNYFNNSNIFGIQFCEYDSIKYNILTGCSVNLYLFKKHLFSQYSSCRLCIENAEKLINIISGEF